MTVGLRQAEGQVQSGLHVLLGPHDEPGGSHCSLGWFTTPSPQNGQVQSDLQKPPPGQSENGGSHCSLGWFTRPSPQNGSGPGQLIPSAAARGYCSQITSSRMAPAALSTQLAMSLTEAMRLSQGGVEASGQTSHHRGGVVYV